jgi:hypothetical protein
MTNTFARGVPGIVVSRPGVYSYGPERREKTTNPKVYPGPIEPVSYKFVREKDQPPPWTVKNQWPEGAGIMADEELRVSRKALRTLLL